MKRLLLSAILLAASAFAEDTFVYLSKAGKTYHRSPTCSVLSRSKVRYSATKAAAAEHGLKECARCYRTNASKAARPWAKEVK